MNTDLFKYIQELKSDTKEALMIQHNIKEGYKIRILNRGEELFYHDLKTNKAFICAIQIRNGSIFKDSIMKWDDGEQIEDRDEILHRIKQYFIDFQKMQPFVR